MRKEISFILIALICISVHAQDENDSPRKVVSSHQIKFGSSIQYEWDGGYYYYDDYYYLDQYYYHPYNSTILADYDGPNTQVFLAYEHIWTYPNTMALGIEPKFGISFRENMKNAFVGVNWKYYWVSTEIWRMGIYLYTGYEYTNSDRTMFVDMENGMYNEQKDIQLNEHVMSYDLGFTPFQFKTRNVPIIIECNVNIIGLHVFRMVSSEYEIAENETTRYKYTEAGGYGPRIELKVGYQIH